MNLTVQQQNVLDKVKQFMQSDASVFILCGYAGTGKTTMIRQIYEYITHDKSPAASVCLTAPTGRAARVLERKVGYPAATIHRTIYNGEIHVMENDNTADTHFKYYFSLNQTGNRNIVIVDEASMLSSLSPDTELFCFGSGKLIDDLLTFTRVGFGGKLILVGDPAQLPPVGESESKALSKEFFENKGLKVVKCELTEVLRQSEDSIILKNAMQIRDLLNSEQRNHLVFETKKGKVEEIPEGELVNSYIKTKIASGRNNCILIAFSNRQVQQYNNEIRQIIFREQNPRLRAGEVLMVVHNNYKLDIMNGEFVELVEVGQVVSRQVPVYVQDGATKRKDYIHLDFVEVKIGKHEEKCWLYLNLLVNGEPSLSVDEHKALFTDFCIRNPGLRKGSQEFADTLQKDVFYNCLQAKYGYAVTGHKCQGGEWGNVFVDYSNRTGLNDDCLRWAYTATTRARKTLYFSNLPHITPFSKFRIDPIQQCSKMNEEYRVIQGGLHSPFHDASAPDYLHAKCCCIIENMKETPYSVIGVISKPYMEIYNIQTPEGVERYNVQYKKGGLFTKALPSMPSQHNEAICKLINDENGLPLVFDYVPSNDIYNKLYDLVKSACQWVGVRITNIVEHAEDYSCVFYFRTCETMSCLKVYIDKSGFVTYAKPMSLIGQNDSELAMVIEEIQKQFE